MMNAVARALPGFLILWLLLSAAEIALVGRLDAQETPVGIGIAFVATAVTMRLLRASGMRYRVRLSWLFLVLLVVRNVVRDTAIVFGVLFARLRGRNIEDAFLDVPFDAGTSDAASATRRALVFAAVSTSPNEIALTVAADGTSMRVHALSVTGGFKHSRAWPL